MLAIIYIYYNINENYIKFEDLYKFFWQEIKKLKKNVAGSLIDLIENFNRDNKIVLSSRENKILSGFRK